MLHIFAFCIHCTCLIFVATAQEFLTSSSAVLLSPFLNFSSYCILRALFGVPVIHANHFLYTGLSYEPGFLINWPNPAMYCSTSNTPLGQSAKFDTVCIGYKADEKNGDRSHGDLNHFVFTLEHHIA